MSIDPGSTYDTLILYKNKMPIWTVNGIYSGDAMAGLVVGLVTFITNLVDENYILTDEYIEIRKNTEKIFIVLSHIRVNRITPIIALFDNQKQSFEHALMNYIIQDKIPSNLLNQYRPDPKHYGWWIRKFCLECPDRDIYTLYSFKTHEFIQSFIDICNIMGIDFRNYATWSPFKYLRENGTWKLKNYSIEGYDTDELELNPRIPAPVGAFYVDRNEADPDAVDYA